MIQSFVCSFKIVLNTYKQIKMANNQSVPKANNESTKSDNKTTDSKTGSHDYEDISLEIYHQRGQHSKPAGWAYNFVNLRCKSKIVKATENSPLVKLLLSALKSKGCEFDIDRHITCENCSDKVTGGYDTRTNQIIMCQNQVYTEDMTQGVMAHELIHMFDYCRAKMDFTNLDHIACSEIRAANLVHCSMTSSIMIGTTGVNRVAASHKTCVKAKALSSILAVRKGFSVEEGTAIIDRVFDRCYNDLEPIGRRIRLNSQHMKWAYRERFHYDYDNII